MAKQKPLRVKAFGSQRDLGAIESVFLSDALTVVQWMLRGVNDRKRGNRATATRKRPRPAEDEAKRTAQDAAKETKCSAVLEALRDPRGTIFPIKRPRITMERAAAAEDALRRSDACPHDSFDDVLAALQRWYEEAQREFSASKHYDAARAAKYTEHNIVPQQRLTARCLDLVELPEKPAGPAAEVVLDIACGSGICVGAVRKARPHAFVIGFDSASAMLELVPPEYADTIQADMSQRLPFRDQSFDWALSVSAIHFLREPGTRRQFFAGLASSTRSGDAQAVCQFYPSNDEEARGMRDAARSTGWTHALLVKDQSHHRNSVRTFLQLSRDRASGEHVCALYEDEAACFLQASAAAQSEAEHRAWVRDEHARFARDAMRKSRHEHEQGAVEPAVQARSIGHRLMTAFAGKVPDLETVKHELDAKVLPVLHQIKDREQQR